MFDYDYYSKFLLRPPFLKDNIGGAKYTPKRSQKLKNKKRKKAKNNEKK